jgi:hypothetical protein
MYAKARLFATITPVWRCTHREVVGERPKKPNSVISKRFLLGAVIGLEFALGFSSELEMGVWAVQATPAIIRGVRGVIQYEKDEMAWQLDMYEIGQKRGMLLTEKACWSKELFDL